MKVEVTIFKDYVDSHKDEWYEEGRENGIGIGRENESIKIAKRMLESDYPVDEIKRLTKLDKQKIIALKGEK